MVFALMKRLCGFCSRREGMLLHAGCDGTRWVVDCSVDIDLGAFCPDSGGNLLCNGATNPEDVLVGSYFPEGSIISTGHRNCDCR